MLNTIFSSVITAGTITPVSFFLSTAVAFALGLCIALCSLRMQEHSQSFVITLALLPMIVEVVIMLVNGNLGAGVAVAGAFSLVRFRSAQGTGQEITQVFLAMAVGLAASMGAFLLAAGAKGKRYAPHRFCALRVHAAVSLRLRDRKPQGEDAARHHSRDAGF